MEIYAIVAPEGAGKTAFLSNLREHLIGNSDIEEVFYHKYDGMDFHSLLKRGKSRFLIYSQGDYKISTCRAYELAENCECNVLIAACRDAVRNKYCNLFRSSEPNYIPFSKCEENNIFNDLVQIIINNG